MCPLSHVGAPRFPMQLPNVKKGKLGNWLACRIQMPKKGPRLLGTSG